jgi:PAS domain S-box-containing protein
MYLKTKNSKYIFFARLIIALGFLFTAIIKSSLTTDKIDSFYFIFFLTFTAITLLPFDGSSKKNYLPGLISDKSFYDSLLILAISAAFPNKIVLLQSLFPLIILNATKNNNNFFGLLSTVILSLAAVLAFLQTKLAAHLLQEIASAWISFLLLKIFSSKLSSYQNTISLRETELERTFKLAEKITTSLNLEDIIDLVIDELGSFINYENFTLFLLDEKKNKLKLFKAVLKDYSLSETEKLIGKEVDVDYKSAGGAAAAILWQKDFYFQNIDPLTVPEGVNKESIEILGLKSVYLSPIVYHGKSIGVITLSSSKPDMNVGNKEINLIRRIVYQIAPFINNARLFNELELSNKFTEKIIETSPIGILTFDLEGIITKENPVVRDVFTDKNTSLLGKNIFSLMSEKQNNLSDLLKEAVKGIPFLKPDFHLNAPDGRHFILNASLNPIKTDNKLSGVLLMFADNTQRALAEERLKQRNEIIENDLLIAKKIQMNLLPSESPKWDNFHFSEIYIPMDKLGGDFFDYIEIDENNLGILITDVSGHGVPAAFITSMIKTTINFKKEVLLKPDLFFSMLRDALFHHLGNMYFTGFYIVLNKTNGKIIFSNAGHVPPVIMRRSTKEIIKLHLSGSIIGLVPFGEYNKSSFHLKPKDRLVLFTDGLIENFENGVHDFEHMYGTERLEEFMAGNMDLKTDVFLKRLFEDIDKFKNTDNYIDDISVVTIDAD